MEDLLKPYINKSINKKKLKSLDKLKPLIFNFPFFKSIIDNYPNSGDIICNNILSNLTFIEYKPNQIILKKGDTINGIYIIFTGEIYLFDSDFFEKEENFKKYKLDSKKIIKNNIIKANKRNNIFDSIYNIYDINLVPNTILSPGYALGESINNSESYISNKIAQASKKSILGYIKSNQYNKILNEIKDLEVSQIILFIKSLNIFGNMNNFIDKMKQYLNHKRYPKGSYIFKQGDEFKTFYIIKKGTVNISININKTIKSSIEQDILIGQNNNLNFTNGRKHELRGYFTENFNYNLVDFGNGEIIGDIEYYKKYTKFIFTVKCLTSVDLFEVNLNMFKKLEKEFIDNLSKFHEKIKQKILFFEKRIKEINSTTKRKNEDILEKDKFTKIFLNNYACKENKINNKYINCFVKPLGVIRLKFNSKKMLNSSFGYNLNWSSIKNVNKINSNEGRLRCSSARSLISNKINFFLRNSKNKKTLKKTKSLFKNKSITNFSYNNLLIQSSNKKDSLDDKLIKKKISYKAFKFINDFNYKSPKIYYNIMEKSMTPGKKFLDFLACKDKNDKYEKRNRNELTYLINEKNKKLYQKCEEVSKSFFILNNVGIKSNSIKQSFFFPTNKS